MLLHFIYIHICLSLSEMFSSIVLDLSQYGVSMIEMFVGSAWYRCLGAKGSAWYRCQHGFGKKSKVKLCNIISLDNHTHNIFLNRWGDQAYFREWQWKWSSKHADNTGHHSCTAEVREKVLTVDYKLYLISFFKVTVCWDSIKATKVLKKYTKAKWLSCFGTRKQWTANFIYT